MNKGHQTVLLSIRKVVKQPIEWTETGKDKGSQLRTALVLVLALPVLVEESGNNVSSAEIIRQVLVVVNYRTVL